MANYMGKDRLKKILFHYILGRYGEKTYNDIISVIKELKTEKFYKQQRADAKGAFYTYDRSSIPGCNEWILCHCTCAGHHFDVEACGAAGAKLKQVTIIDRYVFENLSCADFFYTFYDENFNPKANETLLRGNIVQTLEFDVIKPFTDENTTYKGIERDICICYDISQNA